MDQTTDTFIIVKSGQDATPLAGSNSLAFPGSGAGLPGCVIPPGEASEKRIAAVCPCGRNSERTCARWVGLCGGRKLPLALVINEGRQGTDLPRRGRQAERHLPLSSKGVTAVFCEPKAEKNSVRRGIIPLWKKRGRTDRANHQTPALHFREGAFVGEPQVPTTFERSVSAAEIPPQRSASSGSRSPPNKKAPGWVPFYLAETVGFEPTCLSLDKTISSHFPLMTFGGN